MSHEKNPPDVVIEGRTFTRIKNFMRTTGMARETINKYIKAGKLTGIRIGRCIWVDKNALTNAVK